MVPWFHDPRRLPAVAGLLLLVAGCDPGAGALTPVRGTVSYQGIPLHTGTIVFTTDPQRGTSGPVARADIQPDGTYVLRTGDEPGAVAGWHRVTVVAFEAGAPPSPGERFVVPRALLPEKYRDPELSGLVREVKAGRDNVLDLDLE